MAKLGFQLKQRRNRLHLTQRQLHEASGVDQATIARIEAGRMPLVSPHLGPLAQALGIEVINPLGENDEPVILQGVIIPAWAQSTAAKCVAAEDNEKSREPIQHVMSLKKHSRRAFAVIIEDDANAPSLKTGHFLIADPETDPAPGKFVVAQCNADPRAVIARYAARLPDANGNPVFELIPENTLYPSIRSDQQALVILGVGVEKYQLDI
ncbi:MAG TPA: helix-turn-helix domain-containing protein [Acidobacteriaceae bacterium]|nr:helix-turn-helix domain-containing protein [Acidobacteriaceae bacterium]